MLIHGRDLLFEINSGYPLIKIVIAYIFYVVDINAISITFITQYKNKTCNDNFSIIECSQIGKLSYINISV